MTLVLKVKIAKVFKSKSPIGPKVKKGFGVFNNSFQYSAQLLKGGPSWFFIWSAEAVEWHGLKIFNLVLYLPSMSSVLEKMTTKNKTVLASMLSPETFLMKLPSELSYLKQYVRIHLFPIHKGIHILDQH